MKKETIIELILTLSVLIALIGLTVYLAFNYNDKTLSPDEQIASEADTALQTLNHALNTTPGAKSQTTDASGAQLLIWVGDSRTLGMRDAMDNQDLYIGASGEGYDWFSAEGLPQLKKALEAHPDVPVIFNFGVNDYCNLSNYMELYQQITAAYPDTIFYFLAVNPIDPERCSNITNEEIADFNAHLKELFPDTFLDSYTWMMVEEIETLDGIHYSKEDYRSLYKYVTTQIEKKSSND